MHYGLHQSPIGIGCGVSRHAYCQESVKSCTIAYKGSTIGREGKPSLALVKDRLTIKLNKVINTPDVCGVESQIQQELDSGTIGMCTDKDQAFYALLIGGVTYFGYQEQNPIGIGFGVSKHACCQESVKSRIIANKGAAIGRDGKSSLSLVQDHFG